MQASSQTDWEAVARDPDDAEDLGYRFQELDVFRASDGADSKVFILPHDEELLREEAFIVADVDVLTNLSGTI
jgi:hypothetical protein